LLVYDSDNDEGETHFWLDILYKFLIDFPFCLRRRWNLWHSRWRNVRAEWLVAVSFGAVGFGVAIGNF
jgi:hypothetical protein